MIVFEWRNSEVSYTPPVPFDGTNFRNGTIQIQFSRFLLSGIHRKSSLRLGRHLVAASIFYLLLLRPFLRRMRHSFTQWSTIDLLRIQGMTALTSRGQQRFSSSRYLFKMRHLIRGDLLFGSARLLTSSCRYCRDDESCSSFVYCAIT